MVSLKERDQLEFQKKLQASMQKNNLDALLLTSQEGIFYATGYASKFLSMMKQPGVAYALVPAEGHVKLIINNFEKQTAELQCDPKLIDIIQYDSWIFIDDGEAKSDKKTTQMNLNQSYDLVKKLISQISQSPRIGVEPVALTWKLTEQLYKDYGANQIIDFTDELLMVRVLKTDWEISILRQAAKLAEKATLLTAQELKPGMNEFDMNAIYRKHIDAIDNHAINTTLVTSIGPNYSAPFILRDYQLKQGDIVRLDGGVNYYGYQSDIARTFVIGGDATPEQQSKFDALYEGFSKGLSSVKPGMHLSELFDTVNGTIQKAGIPNYFRGHQGHSIGVSAFSEEAPFIAPKEELVFQEGMVFCLEVPYYSTKGGYNIEDEFLITKTGIERFTKANDSLNWPI
ncbi:Xaa-Pro peptidase family protein [Sporolactobacillus sp. STSJ-5]|uniref:M24 family metallopeptidase n=1 Tax=Sporolactobacillus sp. STSJ-5 TaxID=2965076 RepID=UPI0021046B1A|nr:Xaa-Pro peptidase family protein [Sporolactobacillus sp. STSJ-5]MCQ2009469.1 Xaa-Pro peptidase family protein [Sporolactobacillus sp. STSJ-5]